MENIVEAKSISRQEAMEEIRKNLSEERQGAYYEEQLNKWVDEARIEKY